MDSSFMEAEVSRLFETVYNKACEILQRPGAPEEKMKAVCEYVTAAVTSQSKGLMVSLYTNLSAATLKEDIFQSTENRNKFHDLDLQTDIYRKYIFKVDDKLDFEAAHNWLIEIGVPAALGGGGTILGIALHQPVIVIVAVVVAALLYPLIQTAKNGDSQAAQKQVEAYLASIEREMLAWFDRIEVYYHEQINELKRML